MSGLKLVRHQAEQDKLIEARVKKAGDTMTGNLTMSGAAKVVGNLQGNSDTATRLQNARNISINGVARSFNGTGNISWSLAEIGAAATNHNQTSNSITAMTGYTKPATGGAIATTDSLNTAIGKLEKSLESKANSNHTHNYLPLSGGTISGDILCNVNDKLHLGSSTARFQTVYASILDLGKSTGVYPLGDYTLTFKCGRQQGGESAEIFYGHNGTTYHFEPKWSGDVVLQQSTGLGRSSRKWRDVWSHAGTLQTSDITMKENVKKVVSENDTFKIDKNDTNDISNISSDSIFETVKSIQPITFNYKGSQNAERTVNSDNKQDEYVQVARQLGISAQELEKINPALFEYVGVKTEIENESGEKVQSYSIKTLAFSNMILVALQEEIKYRDKQIALLEEKIKSLEKKVDALIP